MESQLAIDPDPDPPSYKPPRKTRQTHRLGHHSKQQIYHRSLPEKLSLHLGFPPPGSPT